MTRVAIIGAGAVGSYYGARLAQAGHDVSFLMRRDYEAVARGGLRIESPDGDFVLERPSVAHSGAEIGPADWVICALKATAIEDARALVEPCLTPDTRLLVLMNGLGLEERFADWMDPGRIFGGLAFTCINRAEPGRVRHIDYGSVTIAHLRDDPAELRLAAELWRGSRVEITTSPSLLAARWQKLCWNIPFNGLAVAGGGLTTDRILASPELREAAAATIREVVAIGNADLAAHGAAPLLDTEGIARDMIGLTEAMAAYRPSTMIDFVEGRPMEVEAIFDEPLRRARALGVETPRLAMLTGLMRSLDGRRPDGAAEGGRGHDAALATRGA